MLRKPVQRKPIQSGFTLLELVLVLVILGLIAGVSVASLSGFVKRSSRQDTARSLQVLLQEARLTAMQDGVLQRVIVDNVRQVAWTEPVSEASLFFDERQVEERPQDPVTWSPRLMVDANEPETESGIWVFTFDPSGINPMGFLWVQDATGSDVLAAKSATEPYVTLATSDPYFEEVPLEALH